MSHKTLNKNLCPSREIEECTEYHSDPTTMHGGITFVNQKQNAQSNWSASRNWNAVGIIG